MKEIEVNEVKYIKNGTGLISFEGISELLSGTNSAILIILEFIKAKEWPRKGHTLNNELTPIIPLIWGILYPVKSGKLIMKYDVHPTKCMPNRYVSSNPHNISLPLTPEIVTSDNLTLGGCISYATISGKAKTIFEKNPEYCSVFGLPDDCYSEKFEEVFIDTLKNFKDWTLWCLEKTPYLQEKIDPIINVNSMKEEFLPSQHYFYLDTSNNFLRGLFKSRELRELNNVTWFSNGKEYIDKMNPDKDSDYYQFQEKAEYYIKKKLVFEFIRLGHLLLNKDKFSSFRSEGTPNLDFSQESKYSDALCSIKTNLVQRKLSYLTALFNNIKPHLDFESYKKDRFMVMDVEYVQIHYPTRDSSSHFNFPCIYTNLIWQGVRRGFDLNINILDLPCHFCLKDCTEFRGNHIEYDCLAFCQPIIDKQLSIIETLLASYEGFKIYSYGRSDISQLEQASSFFSDTFDIYQLVRKNRKRAKRIIELSIDLSVPGKRLKEIENDILVPWLIGWNRETEKINVTTRFMTRYSSGRWSDNYVSAINVCIDDTISAFLYLLHKKYLSDTELITISLTTLANFNSEV